MQERSPDLTICHAASQEELAEVLAQLRRQKDIRQPCHLFCFLTAVFVSQDNLAFLTKAYNLHPGPSHRPGYRPTHFAYLEKARSHGVTLHEMVAKIDDGPILAQSCFDISQITDLEALEKVTYQRAIKLALENLDVILGLKKPAPYLGKGWSGPSKKPKDLQILKDKMS
jgi:methionyl-tRNA formyltransferase